MLAPSRVHFRRPMTLAVLVLVFPYVFLVALARSRLCSWRIAFLAAAVIWAVVLVALTEGLSLLGALTFPSVFGSWLFLSAGLAWMAWRRRASLAATAPSRPGPIRWSPALAILALGAVTGTLALLALAAPPNTYDSMTYHMSRVVHWIQNADLSHYPTSIARQLHAPPAAELIILHLQILTGGDRLANLVQWFSMVGSLIGVSLLARQLGGNARAQTLAPVMAATIPMGILQATSTQNDYVHSFWLVCLAVFIVRINQFPPGTRVMGWAILVGAALGLALLTKVVAYVFATPLLMWMSAVRIGRDGVRAWRYLALVLATAFLINTGYYGRNLTEYGSPLGPGREGSFDYLNASLGVRSFASVAVRNVGIHLGTPWPEVNALTNTAIRVLHQVLGLDVDDPATTWAGEHFEVSRLRRHEDFAANGYHVVLTLLAVGAVVASGDLRRRRDLVIYVGVLVTSFLVFSSLLRWQPWTSRLQLPLFVLGAPVLGVVFARSRVVAALVTVVSLTTALPWLLHSETKNLLGAGSVFRRDRTAQYFANRADLRDPYRIALETIAARRCTEIGLLMDHNDWEYPLWVMSGNVLGGRRPRLEHLDPRARTDRFVPCSVLATQPVPQPQLVWGGLTYQRVLLAPPVTVFFREIERDSVTGQHDESR